jgi:signal transduction histidine kinase
MANPQKRKGDAAEREAAELLSELLEKFPASDGAAIDYHCQTEEPLFLAQTQRAEALLVVQEALLNARHHAYAERISLRLECGSPDVRIIVEDNGVGFDPGARWSNDHNRFGLNIMRARAARAGARVSIDSAPGQGTPNCPAISRSAMKGTSRELCCSRQP